MDISKLTDIQLVKLINNRWTEAGALWSEIKSYYDANKKVWQNNPEWLSEIPKKRSKARDNRVFLSVETVITNLTGRPSKPNAIPNNDTEEAQTIADNLQKIFLDKYQTLGTKNEMRKGLRNLFFARLGVFKIFWDNQIDDFNQRALNPLSVRFTPTTATKIDDVECFMEEVEKPLSAIIDIFPDKEEEILKRTGYSSLDEIAINNPKEKYYEVWVGDWVIYKFRELILYKEPNPYWDWGGLLMTKEEKAEFTEQRFGSRRRALAQRIKGFQEYRKKAKEAKAFEYEEYYYNHLPRPLPPYIFGTVLEVEDKPIGDTDLISQAIPLQEEIDKRKRQFSDNAEMMNGVWKVDTNIASGFSKADAQKAKADPRGIIYGAGVVNGVIRETGKELPSFLYTDMAHSIGEVDNIFGTQPTFRGEAGGSETATGRAIFREQSYQRLNELIDLVDGWHEQLYNWQFQLIKLRYTERHFTKIIGRDKARETIDLMQDDLDDGIEVRIVPGQILPEDRFYKGERAAEAAKAQMLDPLSFFEMQEWENPQELAKRLIMFRINPLSIIDLTEEDLAKLQKAGQMLGDGGEKDGMKARKIAEMKQKTEQLVNSPQFKKLSEQEQQATIQQIQQQSEALAQAE